MPNKPVPPNGFNLVEEFEPCPECGYIKDVPGLVSRSAAVAAGTNGRLRNACSKGLPGQKFWTGRPESHPGSSDGDSESAGCDIPPGVPGGATLNRWIVMTVCTTHLG
jgi:hypothetical protein